MIYSFSVSSSLNVIVPLSFLTTRTPSSGFSTCITLITASASIPVKSYSPSSPWYCSRSFHKSAFSSSAPSLSSTTSASATVSSSVLVSSPSSTGLSRTSVSSVTSVSEVSSSTSVSVSVLTSSTSSSIKESSPSDRIFLILFSTFSPIIDVTVDWVTSLSFSSRLFLSSSICCTYWLLILLLAIYLIVCFIIY